jgi:cytochrome c553
MQKNVRNGASAMLALALPLLVLDAPVASGAPGEARSPRSADRVSAPRARPGRPKLAQDRQAIRPLMTRYCGSCHDDDAHRGGVSFEDIPEPPLNRTQIELWRRTLHKLRAGEMPPPGKTQPTLEERTRLTRAIETEFFPLDPDRPDPGRVTIRRLNRAEYSNTIRDLVGVDVRPADDFPADDSGYGFDNIGDVLSMSPLLLEKYLAAAEKILAAAIVDDPAAGPVPETHRRIFMAQRAGGSTAESVRAIVAAFARRAFRRPVALDEVERLAGLADRARQRGAGFEQSVRVALQAILVSPAFLFRGELQPDPDNPSLTMPVDEFALASRLSYFLWSSMPDEPLFALAGQRALRKNLAAQVRRMLNDPKSSALAQNFGGQWLQTRNLKFIAPDPGSFPDFDEELRASMGRESELFFENIVNEDRSVLEFLAADYTFVNARLARHYGLQGVSGNEFRRVTLQGTARGGVLTQAGVLAVTSNPTRTSPVKRGKWVLENLLAAAPPPPPPGVPPLGESSDETASATLRQRTERHRKDPLCASCHAQMDPIGFALENFDGIGAWRAKDGALPIDASGRLQSGEAFAGAEQLRDILARRKRDAFVRCLAEKMLTYSLGRGLEHYDEPALDRIATDLARQRYKFSALVEAIIRSVPFQMRRGEGARLQPPMDR